MKVFNELKGISQALRFLEKRKHKFHKETEEKKLLKDMFKKAEEESNIVGVLFFQCPCGQVQEMVGFAKLDPKKEIHKKWIDGEEYPMRPCDRCALIKGTMDELMGKIYGIKGQPVINIMIAMQKEVKKTRKEAQHERDTKEGVQKTDTDVGEKKG